MKVFGKWLPRTARRARKPLKKDWRKQFVKPKLLKCSYKNCLQQWMYSRNGKWARCPSCGNYTKVTTAKKSVGQRITSR